MTQTAMTGRNVRQSPVVTMAIMLDMISPKLEPVNIV